MKFPLLEWTERSDNGYGDIISFGPEKIVTIGLIVDINDITKFVFTESLHHLYCVAFTGDQVTTSHTPAFSVFYLILVLLCLLILIWISNSPNLLAKTRLRSPTVMGSNVYSFSIFLYSFIVEIFYNCSFSFNFTLLFIVEGPSTILFVLIEFLH